MPAPSIPRPEKGRADTVGEADLAAVLAATDEGICGFGASGWVAYANPAAVRLLGATDRDALMGLSLDALVAEPPVPPLPGPGEPPVVWSDATLRRRDGSTFPATAELRAVTTPGARLVTVLTFRDATGSRARESSLIRAQKMEAVGQLTGGICHDFNNLLTVIVGNLKILTLDELIARDDRELVEDALSAAYDGINLTRRLLSIARDRQLRPRAVDLRLTLRDFARLVSRVLPPSVRLEIDPGSGFVAAVVDRAQLESTVLNLAINARHAMPAGGVLRILVDAIDVADGADVPAGRYARVRVADDGIGMDEATARRAVEPFFTTREGSGGTGLGLSMAYTFARQSGGTLLLDSRPAEGTTVTLLLPWVDRASPPTLVHQGPIGRRRGRATTGARVLVVEDEARVRRLAVRTLIGLGYHVTEAADADQALDRLQSDPIDVVLSDVRMPGPLDGYDLARWIRMHRPDVPVVLVTGFDPLPEGAEAAPAVDAEVLRKPYHDADLARAIEAALLRG
ncbi:MAG: hybrid sensor histidine kinase/response regulator [Deltaproteobacteria bacterium HGW-Deltaproteobacteria-14]|jgi:signal transduction histidine kinase|nr:MAG: hybrid sensor histidine kinase/response regulator [Deltaproteobacteria bacterium HGW-Deltaproteobacteria-14]